MIKKLSVLNTKASSGNLTVEINTGTRTFIVKNGDKELISISFFSPREQPTVKISGLYTKNMSWDLDQIFTNLIPRSCEILGVPSYVKTAHGSSKEVFIKENVSPELEDSLL